jgi:type I restriction enzyme S subunit
LLTPGNFAIGGGFKYDKLKYFDGDVPEEFVLTIGDLLVTMTDLSKQADTLGYPAIVPETPNVRYLHNQRLGLVEIRPDAPLHKRYLFYLLCSREYRHEVIASATGTTVKHTAPKRIAAFKFLLPTHDDQRAIAHILGSLDDKIELNRRMNETLEAMARAIFKSWFIDFDPVRAKAEDSDPRLPDEIAAIFPDSFEDSELGEIPKGWEPSTIGSKFNLTMGQSPPGKTYNETGDGPPFFQGRRDFGFRFPTNRVYCTAPKRLADHGDTLVSVRAPVGDINMAMARCCVGRGVAGIRHKSESRSYTYYAMHTLSDRFARFEAEGTVFGAINKKQFEGLRWLSPPGELVNDFEKIAFSLDERIENNTNETVTLSSLRDTLLPKLISGELRVPDAGKLLESVI